MTQRVQELFSNFATLRRLSTACFHNVLMAGDLTPAQLEMLFALSKFEPVAFKDLAAHQMLQPAAVTQTVESLVQLGLASRAVSEEDRRSWKVSLTDAGRAKIAELKPLAEQHKQAMVGSLTDDEIDQMIHLQHKLIASIKQNLHRNEGEDQ